MTIGNREENQLNPTGVLSYIPSKNKSIREFQKGGWSVEFLRANSFIPRRDVCLQTPVGVQLFLLRYYFGLGNVYWTFRFRGGNPPFWKLQNALSPGGTPGVQLYSFHFIRLEKGVWHFQFTNGNSPFWNLENALSSPGGTPGVQLYSFHFIGLEKGVWHFQFTGGNSPFWNLENALSPEGTSACRVQ